VTNGRGQAAKGDLDDATRRVHGCTRAAIRRALAAGLPREDCLLLMLGYADGLNDAETAAVLGITPEQATDRRVRALQKLRAEVRLGLTTKSTKATKEGLVNRALRPGKES